MGGRAAVLGQSGQVPPGAQERLLDDVFGAAAVIGESFGVGKQGRAVLRVQLAQRIVFGGHGY